VRLAERKAARSGADEEGDTMRFPRTAWTLAALVAACVGVALAQNQGGTGQPQQPQQQAGQGVGSEQAGGAAVNPAQLEGMARGALQKPYFRGASIEPKVEGSRVTLEGTVPSKAHAVAAVMAIYQIPQVEQVNSQLVVGRAGGGPQTGPLGGTVRSGSAPLQGTFQPIDIVAAVVPGGTLKPGEMTLPAGASANTLDRFRVSSQGGGNLQGGMEQAIENDRRRAQQERQQPQPAPQPQQPAPPR
jgi:hypothetical protein